MPIPDTTIFGPHISESRGITFGEIRQITDDNLKLQYLKLRLEGFLNNQIEPITNVYAPFPLTVMTCIAVETLGRVIEPVKKYQNDSRQKQEIPKIVSIKIYGMLDKTLSRSLTKEFKNQMKTLWPTDDVKKISSYAELFHSYLRTSFIHGYRAKNVFLNDSIGFEWKIDNGFLIINPHWLWKSYKKVFKECFEQILNTKELNNPFKINALAYYHKLINE